MHHHPRILTTLACMLACTTTTSLTRASYVLSDTYDTSNFFDAFSFFSGPDPTHGFVDYLSREAANASGLAGYQGSSVILHVDHTTTIDPSTASSSGRASVRLTSNRAYTHGLFVADIAHMPSSTCGVWPAFWSFGPGWPGSGEIDIVEGVNAQTSGNAMTLHTSAGCRMSAAGAAPGTTVLDADCNAGGGNVGCSQRSNDPTSYGDGFNGAGGGVYAMEWTSAHIAIWFFPRGAVPADISALAPDPGTWGAPTARFGGDGDGNGGCNIDAHFSQHNLVFDTTFCGDWAGAVWASDARCAPLAPTCEAYVARNPQAFVDAFWAINSVRAYVDQPVVRGRKQVAFTA